MLNIDWNNIDIYTDEEITYFLYLEGKNIDAICKIRNLSRDIVENGIINGKIKYGILVKSNNERELFNSISSSGKFDKIDILKNLDNINKHRLVEFINRNYSDMKTKDKENAIWILGELKSKLGFNILIKGTVHNHVNVRRMAVSALGKLGDKSGEVALIRALDDINPQVVMYAIKALAKIKSHRALKKIEYIKDLKCKEYVRKSAEEYINAINNEIKRGNLT
ncbi:HEAT repeat protein [Clostridium algifaecis]|uniref:HEAT repeat protein n=1 Tax=Clostridium algifaecis TaxID=1472040 RepID=A0ABS4KSN7_9CLOT|nr:HEAT repeat protein [Clostridium algifaecis]